MGQFKNMLCDYESDNHGELGEKFIEEHQKEFDFFKSHTHYRNEEEVIEWFLEEKEEEYFRFVEEECQSMLCSKADALYDAVKEGDVEIEGFTYVEHEEKEK